MKDEGSKPWEDDGNCYMCGVHNHEGFKLTFALDNGEIETSFVAQKRHQGYKDVLHGGILAMVMDEVMVLLPYRLFGSAVATAEFTVRLIHPVAVGSRLRVRARFEGKARPGQRLYHVGAKVMLDDDTVVASATGKCMRVQ